MKNIFIVSCLILVSTFGVHAQTANTAIKKNRAAHPSALNNREFSKYWTVESESPDYQLTFRGDTAEIVSPLGLTLWRNEKMSGEVTIEYDACVMDEGKPGDRLSDLNCFWMASDPKHPADLWKRKKWRKGIFQRCYSLQLYYLGYGGNHNSTTRFRRYEGDERGITDPAARPAILKEYTDKKHLLTPNRWYHIRIVSRGNRISYYIDNELLVDFRDPQPLTSGWFGFRTTLSRTRITNFNYTAAQPDDAPVHVGWVGQTPGIQTPVSFGVPFGKGDVHPHQAVGLQTEGGESLSADFWPLAYWPDGSVKWGGFASVLPAHTPKVMLNMQASKSSVSSPLKVTQKNQTLTVQTGVITAYLSEQKSALLDSLYYGDVKIGGCATIVCATQNRPLQAGETEQITYRNYQSKVKKIVVERVGDVRALIRLEGVHEREGKEWLPFVVRLYFYAGSEQIRMVHTFTYDGDQEHDFISHLGVRFEVPLREALYNRHIAFSTADGGVWSEPVQPLVGRRVLQLNTDCSWQEQQMSGKRIPSYEAFDATNRSLLDHWASWGDYRLSQLNADAFTIRKRTASQHPWIGTFSGTRSSGYAFAGDVSGGLGVCLHDFWQSYPAALEVNNARTPHASLTVWLWSPEAGAMDLRHYDKVAHDLNASYEDVQEGLSTPYGIARTHTLTLMPRSTYGGKADMALQAEALSSSAPLMCTPEYLHRQRAFGVWSLPDRSTSFRHQVEDRLDAYLTYYQRAIEQHKWYGFWNYGDVMHAYDPVRHEWKYDVGGFAWDNTELASNMWLWYSFLRSGRADVWKMAEAMTRHTGEVDVYHLGENAGLGSRHNVSHWGCGAKEARISQAAWNRFYHYLTTDERTGDLMTEVKDSEQKLYTLDPMRLAEPRSKFPCTAPARLRIGPDWLAYAGNWMTEWERTGNLSYRDKIVAGMKSISALPNGMFTGPKTLGFDPATGIISYEGDSTLQNTNHLMTIMGGFEVMNEMEEMISLPAFHQTWLDHAAQYKQKAAALSRNHFRISRLSAYAAYHLRQPSLGKEAWNDLLKTDSKGALPAFFVNQLMPPEVPAQRDENASISTNDVATWSLDAIYLLETLEDN